MAATRGLWASVTIAFVIGVAPAAAQVRGVYPLGMSATNSGVISEPGVSYANQLLFYSRDELTDADGHPTATGNNSVILAMNSFVWVAPRRLPGQTIFSMSATLPLTNNALSSDRDGAISGGGGFADSYYQPVILGWRPGRTALKAVYGFLAPTGHYDPESNSNAGSGYWTHVVASGQTWYLTASRAVSLSAFQMYEWHTTQRGTGVKPGDTMNLDYSLMADVMRRPGVVLQVGPVGYNQWQATGTRKPGQAATGDRYDVNSLGFAASAAWPARGVSLSLKYFKEFANRSTFEGYSTQISGSVAF